MTNEEYRKHLESLPLTSKDAEQPTLQALYEKVFGVKPASRAKKKKVVEELHEKFCELNADNPSAEEPSEEEPTEEEAPKKVAKGSRNGSRRGKIIELVQENIWDTATLAEWLTLVNPEWPTGKNKSAISGTLADMRKNQGWVAKTTDEGRIVVNC